MAAWSVVAASLGFPTTLLLALAASGLLLTGIALSGVSRIRATLRECSALSLAATSLCLLCLAAQASVRTQGLVPFLAEQRATATIAATVTTDPRIITTSGGGRQSQVVLVELSVHEVVGRGLRSGADSPVLVFADLSWQNVRWHQQVRATGRFDVAQPGDDVVAVFNASRTPTSTAEPGLVADAADRVRHGLRQAVAGLPGDARGLLPPSSSVTPARPQRTSPQRCARPASPT